MTPGDGQGSRIRYGLEWQPHQTDLDIEVWMIQQGGRYTNPKTGQTHGDGLFQHHRRLQSILWPEDHHHEWSDLILQSICENRIIAIQGPKDASKTRTVSKWALCDYFCHPSDTLFLISSNYIQGLELRVWGDLKGLYHRAKEHWKSGVMGSIPGVPLESKHGIFSDDLDTTGGVRDIRKGLICIAMRESSGQWVGLQKYTGIKQKRRRLIADEMQFYSLAYLSTLANLDKEGMEFKGIFIGNPIGELDPLDRVAEPLDGWGSEGDITETVTWRNRFDGVTIQLYGPDSPANRHPELADKYHYLTNQRDIAKIKRRYGDDTFEYFQQALGIRKPGALALRVYTKDMAEQFGSQDPPMWGTGDTTKVYGLDAAYGGDRCVGIVVEFGQDVNGTQVIAFGEPTVIPIKVYRKSTPLDERVLPEDQIADAVMSACAADSIPPENVFFDSTGRGSLGTSFARRWSASVNPVEFGGVPTDRPVNSDLYTVDPKTHQRRLKTAREHYVKFVTELHFALRYAGEARQLRSLPSSVINELSRRAWMPAPGDRKELVSKEEYKKLYGHSPDFSDAAVVALEGARRRGFNIASMSTARPDDEMPGWKFQLQERARRLRRSYSLTYA